MRTNFKTKEHFDWFIPKQAQRIERFENNIKTGKTKEDRVPAVKRQIFTIGLHSLIAKYSSGVEVGELQKELANVVVGFENGWKDKGDTPADDIHFDNYVLVLWMLSLGVLLDADMETFGRIVAVLDKSKRQDFLFDTIISAKMPDREISDKLTYPKHFGFLKELVDTKDVGQLKDYLDKEWYRTRKLTYWYDNHKSKADTFFGYWSIESAAMVKVLGLDDGTLKDQQHYPYDLAHWMD